MEPLIFQLGKKGRTAGAHLLEGVGEMELPNNALRDKPPLLPEVSELDVVRHYTRLSQKNFSYVPVKQLTLSVEVGFKKRGRRHTVY